MKNVMKKFWNDEAGFVVTVEMILVATVLVIGLVTGLTMLRDSVLSELSDTAQAFGSINQSVGFTGTTYAGAVAAGASAEGSLFVDAPDSADLFTAGIGLVVGDGLAIAPSAAGEIAQ